MWPFGGGDTELSRTPPNATEYKCDAGKGFWVRNLDGGDVWLIAPDREIRLAKRRDGWSAGRTRLDLSEENATLFDPPTTYTGCKRASKN